MTFSRSSGRFQVISFTFSADCFLETSTRDVGSKMCNQHTVKLTRLNRRAQHFFAMVVLISMTSMTPLPEKKMICSFLWAI